MTRDMATFLIGAPLENLYLVMALSMLRMVGFCYGFIAFTWGLGTNLTLRVGIAFTMSIPIMIGFIPEASQLAEEASALELTFIASKELLLGYAVGIVASGPFRAMQYAGSIIDTFRGESDSGLVTPDGAQIQTISNFYLTIGIFVFVSIGGLWELFEIVYKTFSIWPLELGFPDFYEGAAEIVVDTLTHALKLALFIAAPLMTLLVGTEFVLMLAAKIGRRFSLYSFSFLLKNLIVIFTLPIVAQLMIYIAEKYTQEAIFSLPTIESFFK